MDVIRESAEWWGERVLEHLDEMRRLDLAGLSAAADLREQSAVYAAIFAGTAYRLMPLRITCAWCQAEMVPGRLPESHGICQICLARELSQEATCPTVTA